MSKILRKLEIIRFPNPRLRLRSKPVEQVNDDLRSFASAMLNTMYADKGIGLSAIQVNRPIRLMVLDTAWPEKKSGENTRTELEKKITHPLILFNPKILKTSGRVDSLEGCLSIPTYFETVERYKWIQIHAWDENQKRIELETDGLLSTCIQHEIDHMDGKLFIDRLSPLKSKMLKSKILTQGYVEKENQK